MICRKWDVNAVTGRYLSTDFLISDGKGNTMHCTAKSKTSHNFVDRLKEGIIYNINDFVVLPNTEDYRIKKESAYMIEFHGGTTVRRSPVKADGFVRHPFDLIDFDDLQFSNNKYLIDVVGYVKNVGRSTKQRTGSKTLNFYLTNQRGQSVRVTLWGSLGDVLIEKKIKSSGLHAVILTSVNAKLYNNKLYLSSSSSTLILDDAEIPAMKEFTSEARAGTLENLLIWARNRNNDSVTFNCKVKINNIRTRKGWNYPSCGSDKCKKGVTRKEGKFWCDACNKHSEYPIVRYRLELDVSDNTAHTMVVMFDETATELVKFSAESLLEGEDEAEDQPALPQALTNIIGTSHTLELKSHTYYEHGDYESFTCWYICAPESVDESAGSSTVNAGADIGKPNLKRLSKSPSLSTPSEPPKDRRKKSIAIEDSDTEIPAVGSEVPKDDEDGEPASKKKKKRYIMEDSESE
ncbi:hypothetical protein OROMI_010147 [Orobanche minor]